MSPHIEKAYSPPSVTGQSWSRAASHLPESPASAPFRLPALRPTGFHRRLRDSKTLIYYLLFLGVVLAGVFTEGSLSQLKSRGFTVLYFPYDMIVNAFGRIGVNVAFDESTPDEEFRACVESITALRQEQTQALKRHLTESNTPQIDAFLRELQQALDRMIEAVIIVPLYGEESRFASVEEALDFLNTYSVYEGCGEFRRYELLVRYTNGDSITGSFSTREKAIHFLKYVCS